MALISEELLPLARFRQMRETSPLLRYEQNRPWHVYAYDDVKRVLGDFESFSSQKQGEPTAEEPIESSMLRRDPPRHRQLRSLVTQVFTPKAVADMAPMIGEVARDLLSRAGKADSFDAILDFAGPLPVIIIAEMLGIPAADREQFKQWSDALVGHDAERFYRCQREMSEYFREAAKGRKGKPAPDLISRLVAAREKAADGLTEQELIGFCILLLVAGNETTTNLIGSAVLCLDALEEERELLTADPERVSPAIEEVLRYCSPVQKVIRRVKRETELCGQTLRPGEDVHAWIGSANHDETVFDKPELFMLGRQPNPHLAFGHGIHFCLGAQLARLEAAIAIRELLAAFPHFARDRSQPLKRVESWLVFGVERLPVRLRP